jgi:hypothetical protein
LGMGLLVNLVFEVDQRERRTISEKLDARQG